MFSQPLTLISINAFLRLGVAAEVGEEFKDLADHLGRRPVRNIHLSQNLDARHTVCAREGDKVVRVDQMQEVVVGFEQTSIGREGNRIIFCYW